MDKLLKFLVDSFGVIISLFLYFKAPDNSSKYYCQICAVSYILVIWPAVYYDIRRKNYISFNTLFFLALFLATFIVPLFIGSNINSFILFEKYICKGTALVVLASSLYVIGWKQGIRKSKVTKIKPLPRISNRIRSILHLLCLLSTFMYTYFLLLFIKYYLGSSNDALTGPPVTIIQTIMPLTLIIDAFAYKHKKQGGVSFLSFAWYSFIPLICSLYIIISSIIIVGDRTMPLFLLVTIAATYVFLVRKMKGLFLLISAFFFMSIFYTMGRVRSGDQSYYGSNLTEMANTTSDVVRQANDAETLFEDFIPASMSIYMLYYWRDVNNDKLYYPGKIFFIPFSPIPYVPSIIARMMYGVEKQGDLSSGKLTTQLRDEKIGILKSGVGTHAVADIYVSYGIVGVFVFFYFFGMLIGYTCYRLSYSIYSALVYITLTGDAFYIARATLLMDLRAIVYQMLVFYILISIYQVRLKVKK